MIKFTADQATGRKLFAMGISAINVEVLMEGKPIKVDGALYGLSHDIMLFYGATEQQMVDDLQRAGIQIPTPKRDPDPEAP